MNFIERLGEWLGKQEDKVEQTKSEYWKSRFDEAYEQLQFWTNEYTKMRENYNSSELKITVLEQEISELKDEIDVQKSKAAKYLSYYLELLEKHAPND